MHLYASAELSYVKFSAKF